MADHLGYVLSATDVSQGYQYSKYETAVGFTTSSKGYHQGCHCYSTQRNEVSSDLITLSGDIGNI